MAYNPKLMEGDALKVFLIGTGGPFPNEVRLGPCVAFIAAGEFFLIDIGPGTFRIVSLMRLPTPFLNKILLTHFHSDHIGDLGEANMISWANGRENAIEVYGPEGVEEVVNGFNMAYNHDTGYRLAHHGPDVLSLDAGKLKSNTIKFGDPNEKVLVFEKDGLEVSAFVVDHFPVKPAVGYRIEYKGNVVVVTGDTVKTDNLVKHCKDADMLITEAISFDLLNNMVGGLKRSGMEKAGKIMEDVQTYHMKPVDAAQVAKEAGVKKLVYVHVTPPIPNEASEKRYLEGVSEIFDGEIIMGKDRMKFKLKPKS